MATKKRCADEVAFAGPSELRRIFISHWHVLYDNGYVDVQKADRKKKSVSVQLTEDKTLHNQRVSHDCVIVDSLVDRLCSFRLFSQN